MKLNVLTTQLCDFKRGAISRLSVSADNDYLLSSSDTFVCEYGVNNSLICTFIVIQFFVVNCVEHLKIQPLVECTCFHRFLDYKLNWLIMSRPFNRSDKLQNFISCSSLQNCSNLVTIPQVNTQGFATFNLIKTKY